MTWSIQTWPSQRTNWASKWGCQNCDANEGNTNCDEVHPILCVHSYKGFGRPAYPISGKLASNGWVGGDIEITTRELQGYDIFSKENGDRMCESDLGEGWEMAYYTMGRCFPSMTSTYPVGKTWKWERTAPGEKGFWGYGVALGDVWIWNDVGSSANCES